MTPCSATGKHWDSFKDTTWNQAHCCRAAGCTFYYDSVKFPMSRCHPPEKGSLSEFGHEEQDVSGLSPFPWISGSTLLKDKQTNKQKPLLLCPSLFSTPKASLPHRLTCRFWLNNLIYHFLSPEYQIQLYRLPISSPFSHPEEMERPGLLSTGCPRTYTLNSMSPE